jgi:hypothetical protein
VNASIFARVDLDSFLCERESNEISVDDEIYWGLSTAGLFGDRQERLTRVYTNVDRGERHTFDANTTLYQGYVDTALVCNIQCWEEDDGGSEWMNKLREKLRTISEELMRFVEVMEIYGYLFPPQYGDFLDYVQLAAGIALIIDWLISLFKNPDDLVQQRTILFTQDALRRLANPLNFSPDWVFDGGSEGRHSLRLRWASTPPPVDAPGNIAVLSPANSQWGTAAQIPGTTGSGPAIAVLDGNLHAAVRGMDNVAWVGKLTGITWSGYQRLGANQATTAAPSLAVHDGKLHLGARNAAGDLYVTALDGLTAGPAVKLPGRSSTTPALASRDGALHCAVRGQVDDSFIYMSTRSGANWSSFLKIEGVKTFCAPALATHQDKLYLAYTGLDGVVKVLSHNGTAWSAAAVGSGTGAVADAPFPVPAASNRACGSPAPGFPTSFTAVHAPLPRVRFRSGGRPRAV